MPAASPVVKPLPSVVPVVASEEVLLPCEASGIPQPMVIWQKEGLSIPEGETSQWPAGRARWSFFLLRRPPPSPLGEILHSPAWASCPLRHQQVQQSISSHILLGASATPDTSLNFIHPNPGAHMQVLPSGQLRIMHASPEDAGNYFCIAQNSVGSAMAKTRLVVQGGPRV